MSEDKKPELFLVPTKSYRWGVFIGQLTAWLVFALILWAVFASYWWVLEKLGGNQ